MSHSITFGKALQQLPPLHLRKLEVCRILCRLGDPMPPPSDPLGCCYGVQRRSGLLVAVKARNQRKISTTESVNQR